MQRVHIKTIGGKKYTYIKDSIYIDKGKTISKQKSLGRTGPFFDIGKKIEVFNKEIELLEIHERSQYWKKKISNKKSFQYQTIDDLETLRTKLSRGKNSLLTIGANAMETAFIIDFVYNSNKIEGSRLPRKEVEKNVKKGTKGNNEVVNTIKTIVFFNNIPLPCPLLKLKQGQKILLAHEKTKQGFRKEPFIVGNSNVADPIEIEGKLHDLIKWYKEKENKLYPLELAFLFHYKFERIHPFPDGNGRIGRILMNSILKAHKYHPIIVWDSRRTAYFSAFEKGMEGNIDKYLKFMVGQYMETYKKYIKKIGPAESLDKQLEHFLKPSR